MMGEKQPRNAVLIAAQVSMLLPEEQNEFRNDLAEFIKDSAYTSPELCTSPAIWMKFEFVMKKHIIAVDTDWKKNIIDLYVGKTEFQNL
jgi:hypothetical protein